VSALSFDVAFDRLENFNLEPPRHALVLLCGQGMEPLAALHRQIREALRQAGFKHIGKSFVPHVTLVYDTKPFETPPVAPVSWRVDKYTLIESIHGSGEHLPQGSWMLQ
jgi:2'-5' RNA ligase